MSNSAQSATPVSRIAINREAVKTLALREGVREAARLCGLNESTVKSWSTREGWFNASNPRPKPLDTISERVERTLATRKIKSKVNMSRYAVKASGELAKLPKGRALSQSKQAVNVANVIEKTWPEQRESDQMQTLVNVNILNQ